MRPSKARFVTACQQLLAIGAVLAVLGPAADVVTLDVVVTRPGTAVDAIAEQPTLTRLPGARPDRRGDRPEEKSRVETAPVEPLVTEVPLAAAPRRTTGKREFVSAPEKVTGYGTVGVTWSREDLVGDDEITVLARTKDDGAWSDWTEIEYHEEHGPDPDSDEAKNARPGTDALIVGDVDEVQTKAITEAGVEADGLEMAVIDPGRGVSTEVEPAAIDTAAIDTAAIDTARLERDSEQVVPEGAELDSDQGTIELQAGSYTQKPQIYSRAQWGANEKLRDAGSLRYFEVHAGFVHHTVNANDYTRDEVPGIIRSIYAYHTQTRGWSDVGYNFLVDRFGRIWEGRYGGVDRPVVGAHTLNYNDYSFAMSAIGNYDIAQPSSVMVQAYGRLFAWKLSLHGVDASSTRQKVGGRYFPAINGHRDAASTACPGRYLYAKVPTIRTLAAQTQADWSGRDRTTDMVGGATTPDLVVRRTSDSAALVVPTDGMLRFRSGRISRTDMDRFDVAAVSPDLSGDGKADLFVRNASTGRSGVRPGHGDGTFGGVPRTFSSFAGFDQVAPAGDLNGDGRNDVVARWPGNGQLYLFRGTSTGGFSRILLARAWAGYNLTVASGDLTGDGKADLLSRDAVGNLWLHKGDGASGLAAPTKVAGSWGGYDTIAGYGDFTADGKADLFVRSTSTGRGYVVPGRGNGTFGHWIGPFGAMSGLSGISGADVTGTGGDPDLVGVRGTSLVVVAHRGTQNTLPAIGSGRKFADTTLVLNVGDWDRDGPGDVITRSSTGTLSLYRGLGSGKFAAPVTLATGFSKVVLLSAVGDTTGDGWPDLMGQPSGGAMRIYPGRGTSGLAPSYVAYGTVTAGRQIGLGRWNADGAPDNAFRSGDALTWLAGNGPGGLTGGRGSLSVDLGGYDWVLGVGDVDRNGRPDLVVREKTTGYLWLLSGTTSGFATRRFLAEGFGGYDLAG